MATSNNNSHKKGESTYSTPQRKHKLWSKEKPVFRSFLDDIRDCTCFHISAESFYVSCKLTFFRYVLRVLFSSVLFCLKSNGILNKLLTESHLAIIASSSSGRNLETRCRYVIRISLRFNIPNTVIHHCRTEILFHGYQTLTDEFNFLWLLCSWFSDWFLDWCWPPVC